VETYRISQAAALLGVSADTVRRWWTRAARGGGIPEGKRVIEGPILAAFARTFAEEPGTSRPRPGTASSAS